jgi:hypothetical protein
MKKVISAQDIIWCKINSNLFVSYIGIIIFGGSRYIGSNIVYVFHLLGFVL